MRVTGEGISGFVVGSFEPLSCEVICHYMCPKALQSRIFNFIESMSVQDGDQGIVICDDGKMVNASKENVALLDSPSNS